METRPPIRFGALSILTLVVVICLATLAMLSYATANASGALASRQAARLQDAASAECSGQEWLAEVDAVLDSAETQAASGATTGQVQEYLSDNLPAGSSFTAAESGEQGLIGTISTEVTGRDKRILSITLSIDDSYRYTVTEWNSSVAWSADTSIGNLYSGT